MRRVWGSLGAGAAVAVLLGIGGCQSAPPASGPLPPSSSILGVDVHFPVSLGRDPTLARVWFVRGPVHSAQEALPKLLPATLIKGSRAYLLDPEPGTYFLVAVVSDYAPPRSPVPIAGVTGAVIPGADAGDAIVFPEKMIHRTRTTIAPGAVKFMGTLEVRAGDRVNADTLFMDRVQERLAEAVRPGSTEASGFAARFSSTYTLDPEVSSHRDGPQLRAAFVRDAIEDFGASRWTSVLEAPGPVARETTRRAPPVAPPPSRSATPAPAPAPPPAPDVARTTPTPPPAPSEPLPAPESAPEAADAVPAPPSTSSESDPPTAHDPPRFEPPGSGSPAPGPVAVLSHEPDDARLASERPADPRRGLRFPGVPDGHSLSVVEFGMSHDEVRELLGEPDDKERRLTARGWLPFYTGSDAFRIVWLYDGEGNVVFTIEEGLVTVVGVQVDGTE